MVAACMLWTAAAPAHAWGDLGHRVVALIAYHHLTEGAKSNVEALLAADADTLTPPDIGSRATWADSYRSVNPGTAAWHYVNVEIDHPDLADACFGFPPIGAEAASAGPAQDCVVNKITEFENELRSSATPAPERLLAFKFLMHFVGDLHQPLHVADHRDRGGNCIALVPSPNGHDSNLHAYWDVGVVEALGGSADAIATRLDQRITPQDVIDWQQGTVRTWAMEAFELARKDGYSLASRLPTCAAAGSVALTPRYESAAVADAAL